MLDSCCQVDALYNQFFVSPEAEHAGLRGYSSSARGRIHDRKLQLVHCRFRRRRDLGSYEASSAA